MVVSAAAGDMHSAACTASGVVYTWGFGATGALGHGMDNEEGNGIGGGSSGGGLSNQTTPKRVDAFLTHFRDFVEVAQVECGAYHTLALSKAVTITTTRKRETPRRKENKNQRKAKWREEDGNYDDDDEEDEFVEVVKPGLVYAFGDGESGALGLGAGRGEAATHRSVLPQLVRIPKKPQQQQRGGVTVRKSPNDDSMNTVRGIIDYDNRNEDGDADKEDDDDEIDGLASIRAIAAGHLTSGAVDSDGRLFVWGCPFAEDGVDPADADLVPHESTVASRNDIETTTATTKDKKIGIPGGSSGGDGGRRSGSRDGSLGCVRFRSVGMGGYHVVAATEVHDRWGRPFDQQFAGLPLGLVLPAAKHTRPAVRSEQRRGHNNNVEPDSSSSSSSSSEGGGKGAEDEKKNFLGSGRVGKLSVAPSSDKSKTTDTSSWSGNKEQAGAENDEQLQEQSHRPLFISIDISGSNRKRV